MKINYFLSLVLLFINISLANSQVSPICNSERFANQHNSNEQWNALLDKACTQINSKSYNEAVKTLEEAMTLDSIASKNDYTPNAYIEVMERRLKIYLADLKENEVSQKKEAEQVTKSEIPLPEKTNSTPISEPQSVATKEATINNEPTKTTPIEKTQEIKSEPKIITNETPESTAKKEEVENTKPVITENTETKNASIDPPVEKKEPPVNDPKPVVTEEKTEKTKVKKEDAEIKFTENDKADFQEKGMQKVKQLEGFVVQIGSKTTPLPLKTQATASALKLFESEEKTVQVSSSTSAEKPKYKIRSYLTKLGMLNYSDVKIEWADFQYASDFIKGLDGNYYGYIIFQQRFSATSVDNQQVYSDLTTKKIEIILKLYEKAEQGQVTEQWDVFLGDISVVQTQPK